jgi:hypothetical protein
MIWTGLMTWCAGPVMSRTSVEIRHEQKATIAVAFFVPGANLGWPVRVAVQASLSRCGTSVPADALEQRSEWERRCIRCA